uniref:Polypyrimidine tract-binding protein homolog 3-like n=1 Tax=Nicotiana sylvestris TaxID=4096 RepID=A0A1U7VPZ9_NICSY|nr:PREDICTED: polypyrimidine tract-binding protein homolog 3-like [Nicotiana sylvestris]
MTDPSKVIHVRNVGHEISENDLLQLFQPFGVITKLVMLRAKNQALLQMQDVPSAVKALQFYTNVQPSIRGRNVYVQFSSHQELTTMDQNTQGRGDEPNRILLVTIHHMLYPITVDVLHQVFSPHGFVEKIVTFQKSAGFQALIQFQLQQSAVSARNSLQGRNIYDGCCQLDIQFSNLDELQVNYNNERSRDFTNPNLPSEQKGKSSQQGYGDMYSFQGSGAHAGGFPQMGNAEAIAAAFAGGLPPGISGTNDRCTILVSNLDSDRIDEDKLFNLFSLYGNIIRIKILRNKPDHALVQMGDGFQAELAVHFLKGAILFDKRLEVNFSKHPNITTGPDTHDYSNSNLNRFNRNAAKNYRYCCSPTKMIHLSSLPQDVTEEEIVAHLEEHGPIINSKLFEMNGKQQALVLFEKEEQATEALVCKNGNSSADQLRVLDEHKKALVRIWRELSRAHFIEAAEVHHQRGKGKRVPDNEGIRVKRAVSWAVQMYNILPAGTISIWAGIPHLALSVVIAASSIVERTGYGLFLAGLLKSVLIFPGRGTISSTVGNPSSFTTSIPFSSKDTSLSGTEASTTLSVWEGALAICLL